MLGCKIVGLPPATCNDTKEDGRFLGSQVRGMPAEATGMSTSGNRTCLRPGWLSSRRWRLPSAQKGNDIWGLFRVDECVFLVFLKAMKHEGRRYNMFFQV